FPSTRRGYVPHEIRAQGRGARASLILLLTSSMILINPGGASSAPRHVYHVSESGAEVIFSTCGNVLNGEVCSFTVVFATSSRPISAAEDLLPGQCLFLERITGVRAGPRAIG